LFQGGSKNPEQEKIQRDIEKILELMNNTQAEQTDSLKNELKHEIISEMVKNGGQFDQFIRGKIGESVNESISICNDIRTDLEKLEEIEGIIKEMSNKQFVGVHTLLTEVQKCVVDSVKMELDHTIDDIGSIGQIDSDEEEDIIPPSKLQKTKNTITGTKNKGKKNKNSKTRASVI
jgi:uncharacterized protein YgfB (UPF0149 family)